MRTSSRNPHHAFKHSKARYPAFCSTLCGKRKRRSSSLILRGPSLRGAGSARMTSLSCLSCDGGLTPAFATYASVTRGPVNAAIWQSHALGDRLLARALPSRICSRTAGCLSMSSISARQIVARFFPYRPNGIRPPSISSTASAGRLIENWGLSPSLFSGITQTMELQCNSIVIHF